MRESFARKVLYENNLWWGTAFYEKKVNSPSFVVGKDGENILILRKGRRVQVPSFPYKSCLQDFGPAQGFKNRIRQEERLVMSLLEAVTFDVTLPRRNGRLSHSLITSASHVVEAYDLRASTLIISPDDISQFKNRLSVSFVKDTTYSLVEATGNLLNLGIYAHPDCPQGISYLLPENIFLGRICVFTDKPHKCGMVLFDSRPIVRIEIDS